MKYKITKSQYDATVMKLLDKLIGEISLDKKNIKSGLIDLYDGDENFGDIRTSEFSNIHFFEKNKKVKCKNKLILYTDICKKLDKFFPIIKKQRFAKVVSDFIYQKINIFVDCVEFDHSFKLKKYKYVDVSPEYWEDFKDTFFDKSKETVKKVKKK
jgi:hypothetical protein